MVAGTDISVPNHGTGDCTLSQNSSEYHAPKTAPQLLQPKKTRYTWHCVFPFAAICCCYKRCQTRIGVLFDFFLQKPVGQCCEQNMKSILQGKHRTCLTPHTAFANQVSYVDMSTDRQRSNLMIILPGTPFKRDCKKINKTTIKKNIHVYIFFVCLFIFNKPFAWWKFPQPVFN